MRGLKAEVINGYTRRGKAAVEKKKLVEVECDRAKKAEPCALLAMGEGSERRVITFPTTVVRLLVDKFKRWMRHE